MIAERLRRLLWVDTGPMSALARTLCLPLEALFRVVVSFRGAAFDRGWIKTRVASIPVISVGNLSVGGTGKTPLTAWVAQQLVQEGVRPAIVARGFGQDELDLHAQWNPSVPVLRAPRRIEGAQRAFSQGARVVLLDDGFQHRRLTRDLDIVLVAAEQPFPGALLPRGMFREPTSALRRADMVVVTRKTATPAQAHSVIDQVSRVAPGIPVAVVALSPTGWSTLAGSAAPPPDEPMLAVASIATPETFRGLVEQSTGRCPELMGFADHHPYSQRDAIAIRQRARDRLVVTTEKDAVKLRAFGPEIGEVRVLSLSVGFEDGEAVLRRALERVAHGDAA